MHGVSRAQAFRENREEGKFTLKILSIDPDLLEEAQDLAAQQRKHFSQLVRDLIDESSMKVSCPRRARRGTYVCPMYIRMPTHSIQKLKGICAASGVTASALVRHLLREALSKEDKKKDERD